MVDTVKAGESPTGSLDTWSYTYDPRGLRSTITKPNGNITTQTYHEDGLPRVLVERTDGGQLVSSHSLRFNPDGDRSQDVEKVLKAGTSEYLDQASSYTYTPARQLKQVVKTGVDKGDNETYVYDAAGNVTSQTIGSTSSTMTYDRNRLIKTVSGSTTMNHRYDAFGRSTTTDVGTRVVEQNAYDGYDRLVRQQKFDTAGNPTFTRNQTYDPFDRVTFQSEKVGTAASVSTRYTFVGLADQVAIEEERDTAGTWKVSKSYAYGAGGENLSLVDSPVNGSVSEKSFYGVNPHGDVETLTDATTGQTTSTYRYTAYGQADTKGTTGDDAITADAGQNADIVNPYRFNSKRFNGATGTYDMGFREYNPALNRFLSRDYYNGALKDLALGADPWNTNRYMFAGGNPITGIELDGHYAILENGDRPRYLEIWNERHDTAVDATADQIRLEHPERGVVTTSRQDNSIAGGSFKNPGEKYGYADVMQVGPVPKDGGRREVWIWEVKHGGGAAEDDGKDQVDNYVEYLQRQLGEKYIVRPGYELDPRQTVNKSNPHELITVESKTEEPGVELYDYGSDDPYSVKLRGLRNSTFNEQDEDEPMSLPTLDPKTTGSTAGGVLMVLAMVGYALSPWGMARG